MSDGAELRALATVIGTPPSNLESVAAHFSKHYRKQPIISGTFLRSARHWGLARKGLNIFLRECLYTVYLRDAYSLGLAEAFYEVPLDSLTGTEIHALSRGSTPRWKTVRGLTPELSDVYQAAAGQVAVRKRIARVHLDAYWWGLRTADSRG